MTRSIHLAAILLLPLVAAAPAAVEKPEAPTQAPLFAAVFTTGEKWDTARPPGEQAFFREHSANLKRLREQGAILTGVRYSDKGLLFVTAASEKEARAMFEADPSIAAGTFRLEVHPAQVFYPGCVGKRD